MGRRVQLFWLIPCAVNFSPITIPNFTTDSRPTVVHGDGEYFPWHANRQILPLARRNPLQPAGPAPDRIRSPTPTDAAKRSAGFLAGVYEPRQTDRTSGLSYRHALNQTTFEVPRMVTIIRITDSDRMIFSAAPDPNN